MKKLVSKEDQAFKNVVAACEFSVPDFDHRAHIRLAYAYLVQTNDTDESVRLMREALTGLLEHARVDPAVKYHETLTQTWILAVHHFMNNTESSSSADDFIELNSIMLDLKIMHSHYSAQVLFSDEARHSFVAPDLDPILRHCG